ncbi:hypothetical protein [Burkholderia sp. BCC1644]|uniref:hypothetical protein n=1 Tax=Burkholderia sp. BCC1644 TaxID=2676293 RepID=UPI0015909871|nr:hypothetical protein [Burkholderia sp. BCC1644]
MSTYARIGSIGGVDMVMEIIHPIEDDEGNEIPVTERFTPEFVATLVDVTSVAPTPDQWWTYDGNEFKVPA